MRLMAAGAATAWSFAMTEESAPTILVVDQEPQVLQVVRLVLSREGYQILMARSLREALRIAREHRGWIHLLLVDTFAPEAEDPEVINGLLSSRKEIRAVIISGAQSPQWPNARFLAKPFTPETLCRVVREALGGPAAAGAE